MPEDAEAFERVVRDEGNSPFGGVVGRERSLEGEFVFLFIALYGFQLCWKERVCLSCVLVLLSCIGICRWGGELIDVRGEDVGAV